MQSTNSTPPSRPPRRSAVAAASSGTVFQASRRSSAIREAWIKIRPRRRVAQRRISILLMPCTTKAAQGCFNDNAGTTIVWKVEAPGGLMKAIKFVYGDLETVDKNDDARAEQELKALSRVKTVRHPFILSLERFDIIDGQLLIVMELADRSLWDRFRECRSQGLPGIPRQELIGYFEETAEALDLMNSQYQLQHLDIKPQNLFLVTNHIKVADFGLVKDLEGMAASVTGGVTPVYAAPETFDGWVSRFCDQYSLAIVYQELLTGQRPFNGTSVRQLIMQHVQGKPKLASLPPEDQP